MASITVFGGALGVGLGFGLQKVVSNLVCGVILLLDRSIKPGDVIAINDNTNGAKNYGWVNRLTARCIAVRTRSGEEHLIPNEDFITQKIENWSYTDNNLRLAISLGVGYQTDLDKAKKFC